MASKKANFQYFSKMKTFVFFKSRAFERHIICHNWTIFTDFEKMPFVAQKDNFTSFLHLYDGEKNNQTLLNIHEILHSNII